MIVQVSDGALTDTQAIAVTVTDVSEPLQITAAQDTYINSGSTSNFGTSASLVVNRSGGNLGDGRALLQFDLSAIPAGATVTGATLLLQATANASPFMIDVYRLTEAWVEGSGGTSAANWNNRLPGTAWTGINGASVDSTPAATWATLPPAGAGVHSWDLTNLVRAWQTGSSANYGILLGSTATGTTTVTYNSSEGVTPPRLVVSYKLDVAPTATNLSAAETYAEDTALSLADIVVSDIDSASVTATLTLSNAAAGSLNTGISGTVTSTFIAGVWSASGALANVNTLLAGLTFTPAANFNGNFSIATSISDGVAAPVTGSKAMTGTAVNDAPTASNLGVAESYAEDTALNLTDIVVSDIDSANVTATLTLSNTAAGSLNTATSGTVSSTYNAGTGVWSASGALADVNALLAGLTFTPATNFNSNFTIATSISDGVAAPVTGSKTMTGTAVNDAPTATNRNAAETYTEDVALNLRNIVVSDIDSANVTATLTLSNTAAGSLNTATSGAVSSTYNAGTGVWSASGALADVNTLLDGLTFTPSLNFSSNFSIATSISDGVAAPITGSKAMTGTAVNDAPTASNLGVAESYAEDTALNLTAIVVSDIDSANVTATLTLSNTAAGSLNTATSGTVSSTYNAGTGVWSAQRRAGQRQHASGRTDVHPGLELQQQLHHCHQHQRRGRRPRHRQQDHDRHRGQRCAGRQRRHGLNGLRHCPRCQRQS